MITYDPRGIGRSTRSDGRTDAVPELQAADVHAVIEAVGGPVDLFASSGGAVTALALAATYPNDVLTLVAHEPPMIDVLPDAAAARRARDRLMDAYQADGSGAGMAPFIQMSSWQGEYTTSTSPCPCPTLRSSACLPRTTAPATTRCSRTPRCDHRLLPEGRRSAATPTRVVIAVGEESINAFPGRAAAPAADAARPGRRRLPQPPRRLPRRRVRLRGQARGVRRQTARGARLSTSSAAFSTPP